MELARETRSLELLRLDDAANRVAAHTLGQLDGRRRSRGERLGEPHILVGEAGRRAEPVVGDDNSDRASLGHEWNVQGRRTPILRAAC